MQTMTIQACLSAGSAGARHGMACSDRWVPGDVEDFF